MIFLYKAVEIKLMLEKNEKKKKPKCRPRGKELYFP